jgi:hypothetical protein
MMVEGTKITMEPIDDAVDHVRLGLDSRVQLAREGKAFDL